MDSDTSSTFLTEESSENIQKYCSTAAPSECVDRLREKIVNRLGRKKPAKKNNGQGNVDVKREKNSQLTNSDVTTLTSDSSEKWEDVKENSSDDFGSDDLGSLLSSSYVSSSYENNNSASFENIIVEKITQSFMHTVDALVHFGIECRK